jgi:hypothetical protein
MFGTGAGIITVLGIAWVLLGIAGFIYSLICTPSNKTPSAMRAILGVLIAFVFGPFYWVYWYLDKDYCRGGKSLSMML